MNPDMVLSYVRDLLERMTGDRPAPDADGDLPVVYGGAQFWVRVVAPRDPYVQVFSIAIDGVAATPELFDGLNAMNQRIGFARAFHVKEQVLIETEIWGADVNPSNFQHACANIASATDSYAPQLIELVGGIPAFEKSKQDDYEPGSTTEDANRFGFH